MFDVLVVGGGPAGTVCGLCLARVGAAVAIIEATGYERDRFGETLPPEINPLLAGLGLSQPFLALDPVRSPGIVSAWGGPAAAQDFVANVHGMGWRVDRNAFDSMLLREAASAGARVFANRKAAPLRANGGWVADGLQSRFLVDATGRTGLALDGPCHWEVEDTLLVIAMLVTYPTRPPTDCRCYIETAPSGWWYSGLLPDNCVMAMFFTDPETYQTQGITLGEELADAPLTRERLNPGSIQRSRVVYAPSSCRKRMFGEGWLAVGDAASCYDPLSGRGIFKAMQQASAAAHAIVRALAGDREAIEDYALEVRRAFDIYVPQRRAYYAAERRWPRSQFWNRRA